MIKSLFVSLLFFAQIPFPGPGRAPAGGGGGGSATVAQSAMTHNAGAPSPTASVTLNGVTAGSTIAVWTFMCHGACTQSGASSVSVTDGTVYTPGISCDDTAEREKYPVRLAYLPNAMAGTHNITATFTGTSNTDYTGIIAYEISGASTTDPYDSAASVSACNNGNGTVATISTGANNTATNSAVISVSSAMTGTSSTLTGTGFTAVAGGDGLAAAYRNVNSSAIWTSTWTTGSANWITGIAVFKP